MKIALIARILKKSFSIYLYKKLSELSNTKIYFENVCVDNLKDGVEYVRKEGFDGFFITMPYKKEIIKLTQPDEIACETGVSNCVKFIKGKMISTNTDFKALEKLSGGRIKAKNALIIGNGATAQTGFVFLKKSKITDITIAARRKNKNRFFKDVKRIDLDKIDNTYNIIINATPIGMYSKKKLKLNLREANLIIDFAYANSPTQLVKEAVKNGIKVIDGIDILVNQAIEGIKFITSKDYSIYTEKLIKYLKRGNL